MDSRYIRIGEDLIELEPIAENGDCVLYRYPTDGRICSAPIKEIVSRFPDYRPTREDLGCDYLFEEHGTLVVYNPDGSVADPFEMITEEEINKVK